MILERFKVQATAQVRLDLPPLLLAQGRTIPPVPTKAVLQWQAGLAKTIGHRCDVGAFDVRQQATDIDFGVLRGGLAREDLDKGLPKGMKTRDNLLEQLRRTLAFFQSLALLC